MVLPVFAESFEVGSSYRTHLLLCVVGYALWSSYRPPLLLCVALLIDIVLLIIQSLQPASGLPSLVEPHRSKSCYKTAFMAPGDPARSSTCSSLVSSVSTFLVACSSSWGGSN